MKTITLAVILLAFIFGNAVAGANQSEKMQIQSKESEANTLIGAWVKSPDGEVLGPIAGIVTGPEKRTAFAIIRYWVSDDTQKRVAVPLVALSCEGQNCALTASKDMLDSAPEFVSEEDLDQSELAGEIYRYFGVQPYWTEEGTEK